MSGPWEEAAGGWLRVGRGWLSLGLLCGGLLRQAAAQMQHPDQVTWQQASEARELFENEPAGQHSRAEYHAVMDKFRAIYHQDPGSLYAPRAVNSVAELLAEQGDELKERKSLHDAAGQYEFLARSYPQSSLAAPALLKAEGLLSPAGADDPDEAAKVHAALLQQFPRHQDVTEPRSYARAGATEPSLAARSDPRKTEKAETAEALTNDAADSQRQVAGAAPAMVTGIRHWSTASYTRVAIDLGGEVTFDAARVEHPDRIFFDLHGAKLAPGLVGKSFAINDEGFLKTVRAAQSGADVTRIVLDVAPVAEYSAFLLPNPTRLIIDIHGKPQAGPVHESAAAERTMPVSDLPASPEVLSQRTPTPLPSHGADVGTSGLPPMPVTDGSAGFGLPVRGTQAASPKNSVAQPRVVISSRPTPNHPVPNAVASVAPETTREVAAVSEGGRVISATASSGTHPVVDRVHPSHLAPESTGSAETEVHASAANPAPPTAAGQSTLMRALGLKIGRIVIDAGHGGHDSGTLGAGGIEEKDVVLDVALRLGKLLHDRLGAEIVYTRADDTFVPLETRTAIANKAQADLFISVHANSSSDTSARGVEVYYLNFTSDPEAMQVAGRENAVSSQRVTQLSDLVKKIALKDKIDESRELASDVDAALYGGLRKGNEGLKDRGVKKAPFVVLIGANMPSILAEISFVTNPDDAEELERPAYRERVAESLYNGVARYAAAINGSSGPARKQLKTERASLKQASSDHN